MAQIFFEQSSEVKKIAEQIIDEVRPELSDSKGLIGYYFREGSMNCAAKVKKASAFERFVTGYFFLLFVDRDQWGKFLPDGKLALIDHELMHIKRKPEERMEGEEVIKGWADSADPASWEIRGHDVEDFADILARHGLWNDSAELYVGAYKDDQMTLADILREKEKEEQDELTDQRQRRAS